MLKPTACVLVAALSVSSGIAQEPQTVDGCATLEGTRVALDTVKLEVRTEPGCGALVLALAMPALQPLPRLRTGDFGDYVLVALRAVNRTRETLRAPLYLYADDDLQGTVGGRPIPSWRMRAFVTLHTTYENVLDVTRGDVPPKVFTNSQRLYLVPGLTSVTSAIDSVSPGDASGTLTLRFWVAPDFETFSESLKVRALRAAALIPSQPPGTFPDSLLAPSRLIEADSVPGPFARDLILVRFKPKVPYAVRQRFVDRTHGRVVGGVSNPAGEGDYVLQLPDSPDGRGVFEALRYLGEGRVVARRGVMLARGGAPPSPPLPQGPLAPDAWSVAGVRMVFAADADSLERAATLTRVGARVRARGDFGGELVVVGHDSTPAGIAALARRLQYLPTVVSVLAWTPSDTGSLWLPIGSAPPVDSGQAARDPAIRRFVAALALPSVRAIRDIVFLPSHGLLFFSVTYGQPMEVYAGVIGVRHRNRIGLLLRKSEHPWQVADTTRSFPRFGLRRDDMTLAEASVLDTLEALAQFGLAGEVLQVLVEDPLVPSAVLRRCVRRVYANAGACSGPEVAAAATRIADVGTLTQLALLSGKWSGEGETILPARQGLRRHAPVVLRDPHPPRSTLIALAEAAAAWSPDEALIAQLLAHPAVRSDPGLLALLADDRPSVVRMLTDLIPDRPGVRTTIAALFDRQRILDREAIVALLADPELGRDPAMLAAIANAPSTAFPAASAEAGRRLPGGAQRRGVYTAEPPALR